MFNLREYLLTNAYSTLLPAIPSLCKTEISLGKQSSYLSLLQGTLASSAIYSNSSSFTSSQGAKLSRCSSDFCAASAVSFMQLTLGCWGRLEHTTHCHFFPKLDIPKREAFLSCKVHTSLPQIRDTEHSVLGRGLQLYPITYTFQICMSQWAELLSCSLKSHNKQGREPESNTAKTTGHAPITVWNCTPRQVCRYISRPHSLLQ